MDIQRGVKQAMRGAMRAKVRAQQSGRKRAISLIIIPIILAWISLGGFVGVGAGTGESPVIPATYGATALLAAIGLWKGRNWGFIAYVAWVIVCIVHLLWMQYDLVQLPILEFSGFMALAGLLLTGGGFIAWRGLKRGIQSSR